MKRVDDKISRKELITEDDLTRILHVCGENQRCNIRKIGPASLDTFVIKYALKL